MFNNPEAFFWLKFEDGSYSFGGPIGFEAAWTSFAGGKAVGTEALRAGGEVAAVAFEVVVPTKFFGVVVLAITVVVLAVVDVTSLSTIVLKISSIQSL